MDDFNGHEEMTGMEIAIIGMDGSFPGARNIDEYWNNLCNGVESITWFSDDELMNAGVSSEDLHKPNYIKSRPILDDIEYFDASFFGISSLEAKLMDPQQRLALECAWAAIENAGYNPQKYKGNIGVFAGAKINTFIFNLLKDPKIHQSQDIMQIILGNDLAFLGTRMSYKFNLRGPGVTVQTACSTSLVAVHLACQSLLLDECQIALAGGVSIDVPHQVGYLYEEGSIFSPDGHCRPFDANAQGTIFGSGMGFVVLKRLEDAIKDCDHIYAVIKGSAINNDGSLKASFSAPSVEGQTKVITEALICSNVKADTISYVETHGTGTPLGDPIEILALQNAYQASTKRKQYCAIGSVKANIGHLEAAAGIAGLIKLAIGLEQKKIPPSLNFNEPNPSIDFENSPFYVNRELAEWKAYNGPRRGAVSSFGFGGTNAHVILEEAPVQKCVHHRKPFWLLTFSAKTETALEKILQNMEKHFEENQAGELGDLAYTLQIGREEFQHRSMMVCSSVEDALVALRDEDRRKIARNKTSSGKASVAFMFPGQGSQYVGMARELYRYEVSFRREVDTCCDILSNFIYLDLRDILFSEDTKGDLAADIKQTHITQPALFTIEYALAKLLMGWGIHPKVLIGHSIGEYTAACIAGVITLEDALEIVAMRGRLIQQLPSGAMLTVALSESELIPLLNNEISIAAVNGPKNCVVSGTKDAIKAFEEKLLGLEMSCRILHTSHAFHSHMMEPVIDSFVEFINGIKLSAPQVPFISNITGTWITDGEATDPNYWGRHLRHTVYFSSGIKTMLESNIDILLEIGPGNTLCTLAKQVEDNRGVKILPTVKHIYEQQSDEGFLLNTIGRLWLEGVEIDWEKLYCNEKYQRVPLPTYPFERKRYWIDSKNLVAEQNSNFKDENKYISDCFYLPEWKRTKPFLMSENSKVIGNEKSGWLIFADVLCIAEKTAERLKAFGQYAAVVRAGNEFLKGEKVFLINPLKADDYFRVIKEFTANDVPLKKIIYLWSTIPQRQSAESDTIKSNVQTYCFSGLIYLVQALEKSGIDNEILIEIVSDNMQEVVGNDLHHPEKAIVMGPCKTIPLEYPNIKCKSVDFDFTDIQKTNSDWVVNVLIEELLDNLQYDVVAYRNNYKWVKDFGRIKQVETTSKPGKLKDGGVYLITGGTGGIGLVLAEYLAREVKAKLVLVGRTSQPERDELNNSGQIDETSMKLLKLKVIESLGAEVMVLNADVTCIDQMKGVIDSVNKRFGAIDGVIHAAGISKIELIQDKNPQQNLQVLQTKVAGTLVLSEVLRHEKPDFLLLCSSTAADAGSFGQVEYASANAFLDAFAYHNNHYRNIWTVSVNWDIWRGVGMSAGVEALAEFTGGISPEEGIEVFKYVLNSPYSQVIISRNSLKGTMRNHKKNDTRQKGRTVVNDVCYYKTPESLAEKLICESWEKYLGADSIDVESNFFELGGDSIKAIQIAAYLRKEKIQVEIGQLLKYPVLGELAKNVKICEEELLPNHMGQSLSEPARELWMNRLDPQKREMLVSYIHSIMGSEVEIQDIYPITPTQEKILFYSLYYKGRGIYYECFAFDIEGSFNIELFQKSFNMIIERYGILRTVFTYKKIDRPVQIVIKGRKGKVHFEDLTLLDEAKRVFNIEEFKKKEKKRGFDIDREILTRIAVFKTTPESYKVLWSFHHILMDGWGVAIVVRNLLSIYSSLINGYNISFENEYPYSNYIQWIETRDHQEAFKYWKDYLEGYTCIESLKAFKKVHLEQESKSNEFVFKLEEDTVMQLEKISRECGVTLSTTCQLIWGILLQHFNNTNDVVFGSVVSVRPSEIEGIDRMVGLFVNAIPIRIKSEPDSTFNELASRVQKTMLLCEKYGYLSLMQIQENAGIKQNIADHVITFENFPVTKEVLNLGNIQSDSGLCIRNIEFSERTHFNLSVMFIPGDKLTVILNYNPAVFDEHFAIKVAESYKLLAENIIACKGIPIKSILENL